MLTTYDISRVLSFYDIGNLRSATPSYRGAVNETMFVQTSEGRYVVRRNHRRLHAQVQRYRHRLIERLRERHVFTADLVPNKQGNTLLELDGSLYEVMVFISGHDYTLGHPQQTYTAGAMLATYHQAVEGLPAPPDTNRIRYSAQSILSATETVLERDMMGDLFDMLRWYDRRASQLRAILPDRAYEALPHLVIHGDVHRDNALFVDDYTMALLDFDQAAWDTPLADIADALVAFASVPKSDSVTWGVFRGPLDIPQATTFLEGYASVKTLTRNELETLLVLLEVMWLQSELGRVISTPEGAPDYHLSVMEQGRELSRWLETHRAQLIETWDGIFACARAAEQQPRLAFSAA